MGTRDTMEIPKEVKFVGYKGGDWEMLGSQAAKNPTPLQKKKKM